MNVYEMSDQETGEDVGDFITPPSGDNQGSLGQDERVNYHTYTSAGSKARNPARISAIGLQSFISLQALQVQ